MIILFPHHYYCHHHHHHHRHAAMIRFRAEALTYFWYFKKGRLFETGRLLGTGLIFFFVFAFEKQQNVRNRALIFT